MPYSDIARDRLRPQIAAEVGDYPGDSDETALARLNGLTTAAWLACEAYAPAVYLIDADASLALLGDEAVVRLAAYLWALPALPALEGVDGAASHLAASGAAALLAPYRVRRAGIIGADGAATPAAPSGVPAAPVDVAGIERRVEQSLIAFIGRQDYQDAQAVTGAIMGAVTGLASETWVAARGYLTAITQSGAYAAVKAILEAGSNVTLTPDDAQNRLRIGAAGGTGGSYSLTKARLYAQLVNVLKAGSNVTLTQDGAKNELSVASTATGGTTFTPSAANIFAAVKNILQAGTNVTVTAADAANTLTVAAMQRAAFVPSQSNIYAAVKAILRAGTNVTVTPADSANTLTVAASGGGGGGGSGTPYTLTKARLYNQLVNVLLAGTGVRRVRNDPAYEITFSADHFSPTRQNLYAAVNDLLVAHSSLSKTVDPTLNRITLAVGTLLASNVYAAVKAIITAGSNIGLVADDTHRTLTLSASGGGGMATTAVIYAALKNILRGEGSVTRSHDDGSLTITFHGTSAIASGTTFPPSPAEGERFRLLAGTAQPRSRVFTVSEAQVTLRQLHFHPGFLGNAGATNLYGYSDAYAGTGRATLANKWFVVYAGTAPARSSSKSLKRISFSRVAGRLHDDPAFQNPYTVATTAPEGFPHYREITGLTFAGLRGGDYRITGIRGDDTPLVPDEQFTIGDYTYATISGTSDWRLTPGIAAPWAQQGQPAPRVPANLETITSGPGPGVSITSSSSDVLVAGTVSTFVLRDSSIPRNEDQPAGILEFEGVLRVVGVTSRSVGQQGALSHRFTGWTNIRRVAALLTAFDGRTYVRGASPNHVEIASVPIFVASTGTKIGDFILSVGNNRRSPQLLVYAVRYKPSISSLSPDVAFSLSLDLTITALHQDGG